MEKHGVDFAQAAEVFLDPLALTVPDEEHSTSEVRWITLRGDTRDQYVIVVQIISARHPTKTGIREYDEQP